MKVYINLQRARVELQKMNLKKSGNNTYAGYKYFELADILPAINELLVKHQLFTFVNFTPELATLTVVSTEDGSQVVFSSPMSTANLKGCHDVQNLGAVQTYIRRYLYTNAFEIVESDGLDATTGKDAPAKGGYKLSDAQVNRLIAIAKSKGQSLAIVKKAAARDYNVTDLASLSKKQYDELVNKFESL